MSNDCKETEKRQHLNLSKFAYETVLNDSLTFMGKKNVSGFINKIVENSKTDNLEVLASVEEQRIKDELGTKISAIEQAVINEIAEAHKNSIIRPKESYPKEVALKIRLNLKLSDELSENNWDGEKNGILLGEYIKLLIEQYARKTIYEREEIFYKKTIEKINNYIDLIPEKKTILQITQDNNKYLFKPYRISEKYEANYHYLIGLSQKEGGKDFKIASFRLSRIKDIDSRSMLSGRITKEERAAIDNEIAKRGVPYLLTPTHNYVIRLTKAGMGMYNNMYHQRPVYEKCEENKEDHTFTMYITATDRQITNYFFNFGKEAYIVSPKKTREAMLRRFHEAAESYRE